MRELGFTLRKMQFLWRFYGMQNAPEPGGLAQWFELRTQVKGQQTSIVLL